jgi:hypothetical protein
VINQNRYREEVKSRFNWGNACQHSLRDILYSHLLCKKAKIKTHKAILLRVIYGCETRFLAEGNEYILKVFKNMITRIFGPKCEEARGVWRRCIIRYFVVVQLSKLLLLW